MVEKNINILWPLLHFMFTHAFVEGAGGRHEVELKPGVAKNKPNSWCAVSNCYVRNGLFRDKKWAFEAREEICRTGCHWRQWQEEG